MRNAIFVTGLAIALCPRFAAAQPLFETEHDWTITVGEATFGLRQHLETTGGLRSTQVFLGRLEFHTQWLAPQIVAGRVAVGRSDGCTLWSAHTAMEITEVGQRSSRREAGHSNRCGEATRGFPQGKPNQLPSLRVVPPGFKNPAICPGEFTTVPESPARPAWPAKSAIQPR
ncbi:MAG: hypothetical protein U0872_01890 [Planctomycetaceae bacterium]